MINSEVNINGLGHSGIGMTTYHKQPKKTALRDVQNENKSLMCNHVESSPVLEGRPVIDTTKVSGTKRLTPEFPSKEDRSSLMHVYHKQQKVPQQQNQMRESNVYRIPVATPNQMVPPVTFSFGGTSIPISLGKPVTGLPVAESNCLKGTTEVHHSMDSKVIDDQEREERFLHLQRFLKQCDESNRRDYMQMLLHLSPTDLSRHAVELEKRAIQLTIEEGKEMQRMKALNIFGKSGSTINPLQTTQQQHSKK